MSTTAKRTGAALCALCALALAAALLPAALAPAQAQAATAAPALTVTRAATGKVAVKKGKAYKLGATATAGAKITYKSSKKSVATVTSKGLVKARKAGRATITVRARKDGRTATKKVKVTVVSKSKYKTVKKVTARAAASTLCVGGTTRVKATVTPSKASNRNVTYRSSNTAVATVSAYGKVTARKAGTAKITVTSCANPKRRAAVRIRVRAAGAGSAAGSGRACLTDCNELATTGYYRTVAYGGSAGTPELPTPASSCADDEFLGWHTCLPEDAGYPDAGFCSRAYAAAHESSRVTSLAGRSGTVWLYAWWTSAGGRYEGHAGPEMSIRLSGCTAAEAGSCGTSIAFAWDHGALRTASALPSPERDGACFKGWYLDAACSTPVPDAFEPTASTTVYAKWGEHDTHVEEREHVVLFEDQICSGCLSQGRIAEHPGSDTYKGTLTYDPDTYEWTWDDDCTLYHHAGEISAGRSASWSILMPVPYEVCGDCGHASVCWTVDPAFPRASGKISCTLYPQYGPDEVTVQPTTTITWTPPNAADPYNLTGYRG